MVLVFDFEVLKYDWILVCKAASRDDIPLQIFHNDYDGVEKLLNKQPLFCGFNSKHYDNWIMRGVQMKLDPVQLKECSDLIIEHGVKGWDIPILQAKCRPFYSFDLRDDCQASVSLKSWEAHSGMSIEESSIPFDIDRPLTDEELEELTRYCIHDVEATEQLLYARKDYLDNKIMVGRLAGMEDKQALRLTNAKLTAIVLEATRTPHNDEREYKFPKNLRMEYIPKEVIEFFDSIHDTTIPDEEVFSRKLTIHLGACEIVLAFGGIHGAIPNYIWDERKSNRKVKNDDVGSFYPNIMRLYGCTSRNIPSPQTFVDILAQRMEAKRKGDKAKAAALKLVVNTNYGATLDKDNDLYDPLMGRSVCINGQLFLLELACHLHKEIPGIEFPNINTDGIMFEYDPDQEEQIQAILKEWQERTGFTLEEDDIVQIVQKDVNGYVEVQRDGKVKVKGGYLSRGISTAGAFNINNNATIIPKAIIDYFTKDIPVEQTIGECNDIFQFQLIAKASGLYKEVYQLIDGEKVPMQKCNRVYATEDLTYGTLYKVHNNGGITKIAGLPEACIVDNSNILDISAVDKSWYINLAKKQIADFKGESGKKRVNTRLIHKLMRETLDIFDVVQPTLF